MRGFRDQRTNMAMEEAAMGSHSCRGLSPKRKIGSRDGEFSPLSRRVRLRQSLDMPDSPNDG